ncbi:MAG: tetratricopeptide repeat protein [SAR324 cluster bacterium]|nr:tetratricopeptide repeat protein [SAR324 cluster bacterium]MDP7582552.1 tetratricopeptide repeat protein [SAR324 cluster bacterium]MDP7614674.1 tetratricopeptide repeat protein [SAR324 cluster bacterium]
MKILEKFFSTDDPKKELNSILERGKSLLEKNFYDWAAVEFNKALELDPKLAAETVTKLFQEMQGGGNPDGIISLGVNVLKTDPKNVELANLLGNTYRKKHNWNQAKNMYKLCLKHDPDFKNAIYNLAATNAKIEIADGNAVSAIAEFEKMTDFVLPDIQEGLENLVKMQQHFTLDADEESEQQTEDVKEGNEIKEGTKVSADKNVKEDTNTGEKADKKADEEEIEAEGNSIDSEQTFNYIISNLEAESEEESKACFSLGIHCLQTMEGEIAKNVFKRLLMREKDNVDLRCFLVLAISIEGDIDNAIKTFQSILVRNPNHRYSTVNLGLLYKRKGMIQKSRVSFFTTFKLLERSQGNYNIDACLQDADKLFEENRTKKALEIYEPLVPEITSQELLIRIAKLNVDDNSWDEAFELYRRILRKNRQNKEAREGIKTVHTAYLTAAENYLKKNDPKNAAVLIDKALNIAVSKKLLQKAINLNHLLENENRAFELEQMLKSYQNKEIQVEVQAKISLAEEAEKNGKYKSAVRYYEEAIKLDPQNSTLKKLVDLCVRIKRPDLAEKVSDWFVKYQHSVHEKEKAEAREAFKLSKKKEESQQDDN